MSQLTIDDITDLRAYEREREEFRRSIIALKKKRRIGVGPVVTLLFENRSTIRFQIQEMARAERILSDEGIQTELDIYDPLVSGPGHLAATMFIELTSDADLRRWLPQLVGIETAVELRLGAGSGTRTVRCVVDAEHLKQLTREETTAAVHYVHFHLDEDDMAALATESAVLAVDHERYKYEASLEQETVYELLADLRG